MSKAAGINALLLNGKAFPIQGSLSWGFVSGTSPQSVAINMTPRFADWYAKNSEKGKATLQYIIGEITGGAGETVTSRQNTIKFKKLNVQLNLPSDYAHQTITLEDDRYRWNRVKVFRDFNHTRKSNDVLIFKQLPTSRQNLLREAKILYRERTLKDDGTPWTALEIIQYILTDLLGYNGVDVDTSRANKSAYIPQNEAIDGEDADAVINRMLAFEGNDLYIDEDGKIVIYDRTEPLVERDFNRLFPNGITGRLDGDMRLIDYKAIRPAAIEHLVTPRIEMLFTFRQQSVGATTRDPVATSFDDAAAQLKAGIVYVRNVTRTVIDSQTTDEKGNPVPRGTVVSIDKALEGFGTLYGMAGITTDDLLRYYGADAFMITGAALMQKGSAAAAGLVKYAIDPTAAIVKDAIEKDFRTLFEVPRYVIEQIRELEALHADMLDEVTRTRAPSSVFSTVSWLVPSSVMLPQEMPDGVVLDSFTELEQSTGNRVRRQKYVPISGARVTIEDADLGLIRVDWGQDYDRPGAVKSVVPGEAADEGYYIRQDTNYSYNDRESFSGTGLKVDWECTFVLSVVPDLYRDKRRMYREMRSPPAMKKQDGSVVAVVGNGPLVQRRIRLEDARFTHGIAPYELGEYRPTQNPAAQAVGARGRFVNEAVISAIITAENERIYKTYNDQFEGDMVIYPGKINARIRPTGSLRSIIYTYAQGGRVTISLRAERYRTPDNLLSRLPADVLRATVRQLPAQGGATGL